MLTHVLEGPKPHIFYYEMAWTRVCPTNMVYFDGVHSADLLQAVMFGQNTLWSATWLLGLGRAAQLLEIPLNYEKA
jgi:hypothetical protein